MPNPSTGCHPTQGTRGAITSALLTEGVSGVLFESTRWIGIACIPCIALQTYLFPFPSLAILLLGVVVFIFTRFTERKFTMLLNDFLLDALNTVLGWELPDDAYSEAVNAQAGLMAGIEPEQNCGCNLDWTVH
ncbi:MAG: hypothetical protein Q7K13_02465 [Polynucleobacter sp.]|uniref:hypothetical protein n=1 Tax=Polynucleobacter sp. TaxID=2029855 RepID=UPI00271644B2|nr:hypothetical protein [Polynucleobacter sp.]MDO8713328.1 hypothetical protein [Polynucleobacter sp.]